MPRPLAALICRIAGHTPSKSLAVAFGLDHPVCERCRQPCPRPRTLTR